MILKTVEQEKKDQQNKLKNGDLHRYRLALIKATSRVIIGLIVVLTGAYMLIYQIPIPREAWITAMVIIGALYGVDGALSVLQQNIVKKGE